MWIETLYHAHAANFASVTPFVGVWIETVIIQPGRAYFRSHPSWVCGLKLVCVCACCKASPVTPFVGVWIETDTAPLNDFETLVTPFVGVWIETGN